MKLFLLLAGLLLAAEAFSFKDEFDKMIDTLKTKTEEEIHELMKLDAELVGGSTIVQVADDFPDLSDWKESASGPYRPVVQMHGMGDYAKNPLGMEPLRKFLSKTLNGTYVTNIQIGKTWYDDMMNTFFMPLNQEVEHFAARVRNDTKLANGFNAVGYSQGNLVIRGYVERYNDPPIHNWLSVHGPLAGVAGFPQCNYSAAICKDFDNLLGDLAYENWVQNFLAQANYLRDPKRIPAFNKGDLFLADVNNEKTEKNATYKPNFLKMNMLVLVKALKDTMVWPNESEWFGFYENGSEKNMWNMTETPWYNNDWFGLKTLDTAGKIQTHTTPGNHLKFTETWLGKMADEYFTN